MASSLLWIDPGALRNLLSGVGVETGGRVAPGPGAQAEPRTRFEVPVRAAPTRPPDGAGAPAPSPAPDFQPLAAPGGRGGAEQLPPPPSAKGTLEDRLDLHVQWLIGSTGAYAGFIADHEGLALSMRNAGQDHIAITAALDGAMAPIRNSLRGDPQGSVAIEIDRDNVLQVVWANTPMGRLAVGLVLADSLGGELVRAIRKSIVELFKTNAGGA